MTELLAIIEVEKDKKVLCCDPDCNKSVYKKVHVVRKDEEIIILGEKCFNSRFGHTSVKNSKYTGSSARKLTDEERRLLVENTEILIQKLEKEYINAQAISPPHIDDTKKIKITEKENKIAKKTISTGHNTYLEREVRCLYCGNKMVTLYSFTPAAGFKCEECKSINV